MQLVKLFAYVFWYLLFLYYKSINLIAVIRGNGLLTIATGQKANAEPLRCRGSAIGTRTGLSAVSPFCHSSTLSQSALAVVLPFSLLAD